MRFIAKMLVGCLAGATVAVPGIALCLASGPGAAAGFAVLGDSSVYLGTMKIAGLRGDVGGSSVQLTDKVNVKGNAVADAAYGGALNLGDDSVVHGRCVTGGGDISIVPQHPAKCVGGKDISGTDPLLTTLSNAVDDASALSDALSSLTPTGNLQEIDVPAQTKVTMTFDPGVNVIAVSGRFLVESSSKLTLRAPAGASLIFLVSGALTEQAQGKILLAGGIKPDSVAYVVSGDVLLGVSSSVPGTILSMSGSCLGYEKSKITGALICDEIAFSDHAKMTFAPLRTSFP